ncbi:MAG: bifunctional phosphopantothenoylcysteine decarboxylase/phosphopantothenate--cysteine ligase CoaBC [Cyclobacteriaceae bacterium]|nr:bifunctional phosphopantothenoylcysteine decarboxylase/phosphopantothenate--cysteine ligase CoaBC [Cyclobacteriaceae bacterium]
MPQGKKIILGVTGSIAAYKSALLTRLLVKSGAEVQIVMTDAAKEFITPLTLSTLSNKPVLSSFWTDRQSGKWNSHVDLGLWADLFLIAPASAHTMAKMANGFCDNLLSAIYLSARCPVMLAPAMDVDMFHHESTRENIGKLKQRNHYILPSGTGELASGLIGEGRMAEPEEIMDHITNFFSPIRRFENKKVLITAGPTRESIDPVRYISNHSSGKMGYALAEAFASEGAEVILVSGPVEVKPQNQKIVLHSVNSAEEMYNACLQEHAGADIAVLAAAVADYRPAITAPEKIKKSGSHLEIELIATPDIAMELGKQKKPHQRHIGFALETENELENARSKKSRKNFDLIVLNSLKTPGAGFGTDTNQVTLIGKNDVVETFPLKSKSEVAKDIVNAVAELL